MELSLREPSHYGIISEWTLPLWNSLSLVLPLCLILSLIVYMTLWWHDTPSVGTHSVFGLPCISRIRGTCNPETNNCLFYLPGKIFNFKHKHMAFKVPRSGDGSAKMGRLHCVGEELLPAEHGPHSSTSGTTWWGNYLSIKGICFDHWHNMKRHFIWT